MYTLRAFVLWVLKRRLQHLFRGKRVIVFSGARRSGNHACIDWITNAVIGERAKLQKKDSVYTSRDGELIHLYEVNFYSKFAYIGLLRNARKAIRNAKIIFMSLEDYVASDSDFYAPQNATRIHITRSVLSTISSRITYNVKKAHEGIDRGDMNIDEAFFSLIRRLREKSASNVHIWSYDKWLVDKNWRRTFLDGLQLAVDISPEVGGFGGGSSFLGLNSDRVRSMTDQERWQSIKWPERILRMLNHNTDLLSEEEQQFVAGLKRNFRPEVE